MSHDYSSIADFFLNQSNTDHNLRSSKITTNFLQTQIASKINIGQLFLFFEGIQSQFKTKSLVVSANDCGICLSQFHFLVKSKTFYFSVKSKKPKIVNFAKFCIFLQDI
jgi:hypothetical protein